MKTQMSRMRKWGVGALSLAALFWFFSTALTRPAEENFVLNFFHDVVQLLTQAKHSSSSWASQFYHHYLDLTHAAEENEQLKKENTMLKAKLMVLDEQSHELERLRKLFEFTRAYQQDLVLAEVGPGRRDGPFHRLTALKGGAKGLTIGMPVVTADGVVGRLLRVSKLVSEIQLLVEMDFNLDVLLQRTRVRGILTGAGDLGCKLNLPRGADVRIGDLVVTSGIVGSFPKGIPVGRVIRISFDNTHVSQVVTVDPAVDWRRVEEVVVLNKQDDDLARIIDEAGESWIDHAVNAKGG